MWCKPLLFGVLSTCGHLSWKIILKAQHWSLRQNNKQLNYEQQIYFIAWNYVRWHLKSPLDNAWHHWLKCSFNYCLFSANLQPTNGLEDHLRASWWHNLVPTYVSNCMHSMTLLWKTTYKLLDRVMQCLFYLLRPSSLTCSCIETTRCTLQSSRR